MSKYNGGMIIKFDNKLQTNSIKAINIPKEIKIGGHIIRIQIVDTSQTDSQGSFNNYHNLIRLQAEDDVLSDNIAECLLHEIIEAIKVKNNLELNHVVLSVLSENLFQVLRDNDLSILIKKEN